MQIAGVQKFSLIDYPWKVACVIFTLGCNFRCPYCHNPEFVAWESTKNLLRNLIPEEVFLRFLDKRKGLLDGVSICWWEPTVQKDLYEFCKKVKEKDFFIKLDTNGTNPDLLAKLLSENLVDYVAMDFKHPLDKYDIVSKKHIESDIYKKSIKLIMEKAPDYEFRTTCIKGFHSSEDIEAIASFLVWAKHYYLQNYHAGNTLDPNFDGKSFSLSEMDSFKKMAEKYIDYVAIRK